MFHCPSYKWAPEVKIEGGKVYYVQGVSAPECPVSYITDESKALIELEVMNYHAQKSTGATLYGPDCGQWPAVWHDVVTTVQTQRALDEASFQRSLNNGR